MNMLLLDINGVWREAVFSDSVVKTVTISSNNPWWKKKQSNSFACLSSFSFLVVRSTVLSGASSSAVHLRQWQVYGIRAQKWSAAARPSYKHQKLRNKGVCVSSPSVCSDSCVCFTGLIMSLSVRAFFPPFLHTETLICFLLSLPREWIWNLTATSSSFFPFSAGPSTALNGR